jgi:hypothetical protein
MKNQLVYEMSQGKLLHFKHHGLSSSVTTPHFCSTLKEKSKNKAG